MKKLSFLFIACFVSAQLYAQQDLSQVNSKNDELQPVFHPNGTELYFTRAYDSTNIGGKKDKGDIWVSQLEADGSWSRAKNVGSTINNRHFNAVAGFSPDGKVMFLHGHYPSDDKPPKTQGLSYSVWRGDSWTFPRKIEVEYFLNKSSHQSGSISADGKILLLAIESYGTVGAEDIYVSFYDGSKFSQPKNLGPVINTSMQEMTPTLAPDNKTLFYSSNGKSNSKGGRDIYKSERLDDSWTHWTLPENIGSAVNSEGVELSFIIEPDMKWALYTSTQNSDGYADLKYYKMPEDSIFVQEAASEATGLSIADFQNISTAQKLFAGRIYSDKTRKTVPAEIIVRSRSGKFETALATGESQKQFEISVPDSVERIFVDVKATGYMPITETIVIDKDVLERNYFMVPLEVGTTIQLDRIYFDKGTAQLIDSSYAELNKVADVLRENKTMSIEVSGHTDNQGDAQKNLELSQQRVEVVKQYLVSKGIDASRIAGKGYGGSRPIASNASEETRKLNRRVEFVVTKF